MCIRRFYVFGFSNLNGLLRSLVCLLVMQGRFRMKLKAQRLIGEEPVCGAPSDETEGTIRVKPSTFNNAFNVKASVHCPACDCEKVNKHTQTQFETSKLMKIIYLIHLSLPWSHSQTPVTNAARCHGNGDLVCGKCQCYDDW